MGGRRHGRGHGGDRGGGEALSVMCPPWAGQPWPGDIWQVRLPTAQAQGSGASAECWPAVVCLCVVFIVVLCRGSSVLEVGGGRTRWQPRTRGRRQTRPGHHTANTSRPGHTSCQLPQLPRPRLVAATPPAAGQVGGAAAGWWCAVRAELRSVRPVYWSGPAAGHHLLLYGYVQCSVQSPVCACLSSPTWDHGLVQCAVCSVQCEQGSRAPDNWLINTLSIIQQVDKLCFISQLDNFLLLLRATRPNLEIVDINKLGLLILQPVWPKS